ncbi:GNAT family N-acetyltransferase [Pseudonocardia zijingensis]|jgi:hypothetical protein|uniref:BioF2-like acetyltransferase domain-containing protein n=1 Tax=Pseudonocardia zijingensis TaxID=153376 RepID=A0ABN1P0B3_9PSEU
MTAPASALNGVRIVSPAPRDDWRAVLAADPDATPTQLPEWLDCLRDARGFADASRLYELPDGRRLVLPMAARAPAGIPISEESWPYGWGYGGVLVEGGHGGLTPDDCRVVLADLARRPALRRAVVPAPALGGVWQAAAPPNAVRMPYLTQVLDLEGGFETVWSTRFRSKTRKLVRKAERFELDVRCERGPEAVAGRGLGMFALLYREAVDRWAVQRGQPLAVARRLAAHRDRPGQVAAVAAGLGEHCAIWSATWRGEPVAVKVVLRFGRHSLAWMGARNAALSRETLANYLLQSLAIEDACAAGVRHYNMGESDPGSGVEHAKRVFGAVPVEYQALRFERLPLTRGEQRLRALFGTLSRLNIRRREVGAT